MRDKTEEVAEGVSRIQLSPSSRKAKPHNAFTLIGKAALGNLMWPPTFISHGFEVLCFDFNFNIYSHIHSHIVN